MLVGTQNLPKKAGDSYKDMIIKVAEKVCTENTIPTCAKYEQAIVEIINEGNDYKLKSRDIHSTIYRALKKLVKGNFFFYLGKGYYPDKPTYRRRYYATQIKEKIRFAHKDIHKLSPNACVITLDKNLTTENADISSKKILNLFENYIGKENCYTLNMIDNLLIIMLCENNTSDGTTISHIETLVKDIYQSQTPIKTSLSKKDILRKALDKSYSYYWFDKDIVHDDTALQKRRFLFLGCTPDSVENAYDIIKNEFSDLCESIYLGFSSITVIFDITSTTRYFDKFTSYIK